MRRVDRQREGEREPRSTEAALDGAEVDVSVVISVYRSEQTLDELHRRLSKVLDSLSTAWEIVLVDDASPDGSWSRLEALSALDPRVVSIRLASNVGQHSAQLCGLSRCRGRRVVLMDDDLQHPPEEIPVLLEALEETGADAVVASYDSYKNSRLRRCGSWLAKQVNWTILGIPRSLDLTSFRVLRRATVDGIVQYRGARPRIGLILFSVTSNVRGVRTEHHARAEGRSGYSLPRLVGDFSDNILNYAPRLPLRLITAGSLVWLIALPGWLLVGRSADGVSLGAITVIGLLLVLGLFLLAVGLISALRLRTVHAAGRPQYVIASSANLSA